MLNIKTMKRTIHIIAVLALFCASSSPSQAASDMILDIFPGTILASFKANAFSITGEAGKETMSLVSTMPSIAGGIAIEQPEGYLDLNVGAGVLLNGRFDSFMLFGSGGFSFHVKPSVMVGPHFGIAQFSAPSWWGDGVVTFSDAIGLNGGVHLSLGDKVAYLFSMDYYALEFDIDSTGEGWTASDTSLDMSGLAIKFGLHAQF